MIRITDAETLRLAHELAQATGESVTDAIATAIHQRLARVRASRAEWRAGVEAVQREFAALPVRDARTADDIIGYDDHGVPS